MLRHVGVNTGSLVQASFLEFAPHYFAHLTNMLETNHPSCLSKVLGFFQITMANEWKGDIVITENVFYEKVLSRTFDLKGTVRNPARTGIAAANDSSSVQLDDQLRQTSFQRPLIVAPHERHKLMQALRSDTAFLANVGVMDYSLLLGIDRPNVRPWPPAAPRSVPHMHATRFIAALHPLWHLSQCFTARPPSPEPAAPCMHTMYAPEASSR
jgi:Phosphatidylinositol-4-phosphate 5-Kinase